MYFQYLQRLGVVKPYKSSSNNAGHLFKTLLGSFEDISDEKFREVRSAAGRIVYDRRDDKCIGAGSFLEAIGLPSLEAAAVRKGEKMLAIPDDGVATSRIFSVSIEKERFARGFADGCGSHSSELEDDPTGTHTFNPDDMPKKSIVKRTREPADGTASPGGARVSMSPEVSEPKSGPARPRRS